MKKKDVSVKTIEDAYLNFSESSTTLWFRGILQSLNVKFTPSLGVEVSLGQFFERFFFIQSEIIAQNRVKESMKELNKKLNTIKLNEKRLTTKVEEYAGLFLRFYGAVGSQSFNNLRKAYVSQMATFFDKKYSNTENKLFYQRLLYRLTPDHFVMLKFSNNYLGNEKGTQFEKSKTLKEVLIKKFGNKKGMTEALVRGLIKDLDSIGLFNDWQSSALGGDVHGLAVTDLGRELLFQIEK